MKTPEHSRTARSEARITPAALAVVRRAAGIQGRSLIDFVVAAAQEAGRKTVAEVEVPSAFTGSARAIRIAVDESAGAFGRTYCALLNVIAH